MTDLHPPCEICGGPVVQRPKESMTHFRMRVTCSDRCRKKHNVRLAVEWRRREREKARLIGAGWSGASFRDDIASRAPDIGRVGLPPPSHVPRQGERT
jgi:endogenous inhibitor of DNA gyrase (YacG/DUF329 family)